MTLAALRCSDFAGHVGTTFAIGLPQSGDAPVTLIEASRRRGTDTGHAPFSLVFRSTSSDAWPQSTYQLTHPVMGQLDIFLVPLRQVQNGFDYVATFD